MGKITGLENAKQVPPKVRKMYAAVIQLLTEGADATGIRVSTITDRAGIGKGTAYEYFDSKDEMVACAVVYQLQRVFEWLEGAVSEKETFAEQLNFLLDKMSIRDGRKHAFLRFVNLLTDSSGFSCLVREKMAAEGFSRYRPAHVFGRILQRGVERGELRADLPMDYMIYNIFSHLITFMMAVTSEGCFGVDLRNMRPLVYQGIMNEIGRARGADAPREGKEQGGGTWR